MAHADQPKTEVAVIGAGSIGGFVAGQLAAAGLKVTLCVRSPFAELVVESGGVRRVSKPRIVTDPGPLAPIPWVFLATKAQDTAGAAPWLARLCGPATTVVVLQNGIDQAERVTPLAPAADILPALVYIGAERVAPGHIVQHVGGKLTVPRGDAARRLAAFLDGPGIAVEAVDDFLTCAWTKFLGNIFGNPLTALTMRRLDVFREPGMVELARGLLVEAVAVGRACGAKLPASAVEDTLATITGYSSGGGTSMLYDRLAGRPLEHEHLTGALVRAAERHGIEVPLNRAMLALLAALSDGLAAARRGSEPA